MRFEILSHDLLPVANEIIRYFKSKGYSKIVCEKPLNAGDPIRPTLIFRKRGSTVVVEVKECPVFYDYFEDFVKTCLLRRERVELFLAFPHSVNDNEITYPHSFLDKVNLHGVGVFVVKHKDVIVQNKAVVCNMRITKADIYNVGRHNRKIAPIAQKFNKGEFVDAIRDITELVEELVTTLMINAAKAGNIVPTVSEIEDFDFERKINVLSSSGWKGSDGKSKEQKRYFETQLNLDLKSYKGTRNLSHHPRNTAEQRKLEAECFERMHTGIRLIRELGKIRV